MITIKIFCSCGAKFGFDLPDAAPGRLASAVQCPVCGADATAQAEAEIERQAAAKLVQAVAGSALQQAVAAAPSAQMCAKHGQNPAAANCVACGKPICLDCMAQFGYLCSPYCREVAGRKGIAIPIYAHQKTNLAQQDARKGNLILGALAAAVVMLIGLWAMYSFMLSKPRIGFQIEASKTAPFVFAQWAAKDRVLAATTEKLILADMASGPNAWEAQFKADEKLSEKISFSADAFKPAGTGPLVKMLNGDAWVFFPKRAVRFDLVSGKRKQEIALPLTAAETCLNDEIFAAAADGGPAGRIVARLDLASGEIQTTSIPASPRAGIARALAVTRTQAGAESSTEADELPDCDREFFASGTSVVQLQSRILQLNIGRAGAAGKQQESPDLLDSGSLRASQSTEAVDQFLARASSGPVLEDQSRYSVSLKRILGGGSSWSGEVVGAPAFFPMAGLDLLIAGKTVLAFDKTGRKLWEGKLSFAIAPKYVEEAEQAPGLEAAGKIYIFDQGTLTAFDAGNGSIKWRVQSVGIRKVAHDSKGALYVVSTTAGADQIKASQNLGPGSKINTVLMKLDASSGAILWQTIGTADDVHLSGKMVYAARGRISGVDLFSAATSGDSDAEAPVHHRIYRIDPKTGREIWEYYQPEAPEGMAPKSNRILLQYPEHVRILKFMSL